MIAPTSYPPRVPKDLICRIWRVAALLGMTAWIAWRLEVTRTSGVLHANP